jgi:plastocyanin
MRWLLVVVATLVFAPAAYAQGASVQAVDDTLRWSADEVTIKAGETVTWTWDGDPPHNVDPTIGPWADVPPSSTTSPFSYQFAASGTYDYVCQFHSTMTGRVVVTDTSGTPPPPPPPPPPSEQHWANDQQPPTVFELVDEVRPELRRVRVDGVRNGARVRFRLSERARVTVRFKLAGITVKSARRTLKAGRRSMTIRDPRMHGRYRLEVFARDAVGNRSRMARDRLTVR